MRRDLHSDVDSSSKPGAYFTLAEANEQIEGVRRSFDVIMQLRTQGKKLHDRLEVHGYPAIVDEDGQINLSTTDDIDMDDEPPPAAVLRWAGMLRAVYAAMHEEISTVQATGGVIRDLESGIVDWPALHGDKEIWLCWQYGQFEIAHWNDSGDQRPLSELEDA